MTDSNNNEQKLVAARLSADDRQRLACILTTNRRTFKGQLEQWIADETRYIARRAD